MKNISNHIAAFYSLFIMLLITMAVNGQTNDLQPTKTSAEKNGSWFTVKQIADKVWRIDDHGGDNIYLIEGSEKALLIDTGTGTADLVECVKSITKLPVIVVNTHGHPDHVGGNFQFKEVYAHKMDFEMIGSFCNEGFRANSIERVLNESSEFASSIIKEVENFKAASLLPIHAGYTFDLGNRKLDVVEVPGHTKGSICLLDAENKLLFTGDNNNSLVWLFLEDCLPLESYMQTLENLKQLRGDFETMLPGHGEPLDKEFIDEQIICIKNILDGTCKGEPYKTFVNYAKVCSFKRARVAYNPDNLHVKP